MKNNSGQTLIEVIIAIGLVVLVLVTLVSALTLGIRNNEYAKNQALAKNRVREATEWIRSVREQMGWDSFYAWAVELNGGQPATICVKTIPLTLTETLQFTNQPCLSLDIMPGTNGFYRNMTFTIPGSGDEVDVNTEVSWQSGTKTLKSSSVVNLKKWL